MRKSERYSRETRERAVRLVLEHQNEYGAQWTASGSVAGKIGMHFANAATLGSTG